MSKLRWLLVLRIAALLALGASAALLSDYTSDSPSFCGAGSGCGAVRGSEFSRVALGGGKFVPLPLFGVLGFATLFAASMLSRRATLVTAAVGGLLGLVLLLVQALLLKQFCWLCVTTDGCAVAAAASAFQLRRSGWESGPQARLLPWAWWAFGALALLAPLLWPHVRTAPAVPPAVLRYYRPNAINVVEFADFQCPACRRFSSILKAVLADYGQRERVHFVRLNKPLEMHEYARDAAHAAVCAEAQSKAEPMAEALFSAENLTPIGIDDLARAVGLDAKQFESCMLDVATQARVEREASFLVAPEFEGLPTTYIGGRRLLGVQSPEAVADALERAVRGERPRGIPGYLYLPMLVLIGLLVVRFGSRRAVT